MNIKTKEIDQFAGTVDLGLVNVFTLPQHSRCIDVGPVFGCQQIGSFQKNMRPAFPAHCTPAFMGSECRVDCLFNMSGIARVKMPQRMCPLVRRMNGLFFSGSHFFSTNIHGYIQLMGFQA